MIVSSATLQTCPKKKNQKKNNNREKKRPPLPPSQILCFILARVPRKSTGTTIGAAAQRGPVGRAGRQSVSPVAPILWAYHQLGEHTVRHLPRAVSSSSAAYPVVFLCAAPLPVSCCPPHTHTRGPSSSSISCVPTT
jgi:hypothetical protein